ncbi:MAG: glycoside hydrolase family 2 protein, partial [Clostridiales bacterium]|nr:glycoside hydrolase family 2 protein [Clostridiales bacterium]
MKTQKWNENWLYWEDKDSFALVWGIPQEARKVTLPHDAMLERRAYAESPNGGNTGFRDGGVYAYVKSLFVPEEKKNKLLMLQFEGVYSNALVYVNGQLAGKNNFGYSTFYVPLNDLVTYGAENEIRVQVHNSNTTNSRWYSGSGIYRDVYLLESGLVHLVPEGVQVVTETADEDYAALRVSAELRSRQHSPQHLTMETVLRDPSGGEVAKCQSVLTLLGQEERTVSQRIAVERPQLWSDETPALYTYEIALRDGNAVLDAETGTFGIRALALDAKRGLRVNGKSVKLRGACVHHDSGLLGAATFDEFHLRQAKLLKEAGFNAVRCAHQPMAPAMLRACDQVGLYVMDEFSDMWDRCKSDLDYALTFRDQWAQDLTAMVRKDRIHPSVVLYSVGNEIPEIGTVHGAQVCAQLCKKVKELDPTRYTTAGINGVFACGDRIGEIMADLMQDSDEGQGETGGNVNDFMTVMDSRLDDIVVHRAVSERLEMAGS